MQLEKGNFMIVSSYCTIYHKYLDWIVDSLDKTRVWMVIWLFLQPTQTISDWHDSTFFLIAFNLCQSESKCQSILFIFNNSKWKQTQNIYYCLSAPVTVLGVVGNSKTHKAQVLIFKKLSTYKSNSPMWYKPISSVSRKNGEKCNYFIPSFLIACREYCSPKLPN